MTGMLRRELMLGDGHDMTPKPTPLILRIGIVAPVVVLTDDKFRQAQHVAPERHATEEFIACHGFRLGLDPGLFHGQQRAELPYFLRNAMDGLRGHGPMT